MRGHDPRSDRGFTLVELLVVVALLAILVGIALPRYRDVVVKADAAAVIGDFHVIRLAAEHVRIEGHDYPPSAGWAQVPPAMAPHLGEGFEFGHGEDVRYRWRRWGRTARAQERRRERGRVVAGLDIRSRNPALLRAIRGLYPGRVALARGNRIVLVID